MRKKIKQACSGLVDYTGIPRRRESERLEGRRNAVFIWIPKTAGTSIWKAMDTPKLKSLHLAKHRFTGSGPVTFCHMDYAQLVRDGYVSRAFDESAYKFTFVRNPYDRAVSLFYYMKRIRKRKVDPDISFLDFYRSFKENGFTPIGLYNRKGLSQCNPQVRWTEHIKLDYIGKLETIDKDTALIMGALGLQYTSVEKMNVTAHPDYAHCYCPESKQLIEDLYREDFETFEYAIEVFD
jgi:hypothetical protein